MMKIIFLDIDGVMNNANLIGDYGFDAIGYKMLLTLKRIVEKTNAKIVLSSTWRIVSLNLVKERLSQHEMKLESCTVELIGAPRAKEIQIWLLKNKDSISSFAILDDSSDAGMCGLQHSFFKTDFKIGLTEKIADKVIEHLNAESPLDIGDVSDLIGLEEIKYDEDGLNIEPINYENKTYWELAKVIGR